MSLETEELEIRTRAAKVDIDADNTKSKIRMDSAGGTTRANNSGIKASNKGWPFLNALGAVAGERNSLKAEPVKYATPEIRIEKMVEAIIPR